MRPTAHLPPMPTPAPDLTHLPAGEAVKRCAGRWKELGAPKWVVEQVRYGIRVPFVSAPAPFFRRPVPAVDTREAEARPKLFSKMLAKGRIESFADSTSTPEWVLRWRAEPKRERGEPTGEYRFILDGRDVNRYAPTREYKMETLSDLPDIAERTDFAIVQDFKDYFFSFPLARPSRKYFVIQAPSTPDPDGRYLPNHFYCFTVLPMGYSLSPWYTHKLTMWIRQHFRQLGLGYLQFVDDVLLLARPDQIDDVLTYWLWFVQSLGLQVHSAKGFRDGRSRFIFLGLECSLPDWAFNIPDWKLAILRRRCRRTLQHAWANQRCVPARALARLAGTALSLRLASPAVAYYTRSLFVLLKPQTEQDRAAFRRNPRKRWRLDVKISRRVIRDIEMIADLPMMWRSHEMTTPPETMVLTTDASLTGWGGHLSTPGQGVESLEDVFSETFVTDRPFPHPTAGLWETLHTESGEMVYLELEAVTRAIRAFAPELQESTVRVYVDNMSVVSIINRCRSKSDRVMQGYDALWDELMKYRIKLRAEHVGTEDNVLADRLSRRSDPTDYRHSTDLVKLAQSLFDIVMTVGCFASEAAHQPQMQHHTRYRTPGAPTNTYTTRWGDGVWLTPPFSQVARALQHAKQCNARGVIVHPMWRSATWWPMLQQLTVRRETFDAARFVQPLVSNEATPEPIAGNWLMAMSYISVAPPVCHTVGGHFG